MLMLQKEKDGSVSKMKTRKTMRNILCALSVLILWGNVVSLLLPTDQYGGIIKTIDFSTVLFVVMLLIAVFGERRRDRGHEEESAIPGGDRRARNPAREKS